MKLSLIFIFMISSLFSDLIYAANVSCNYAVTQTGNTSCVVEDEKYAGLIKLEVEAEYENSILEMPTLPAKPMPGTLRGSLTWSDGTIHYLDSSEIDGTVFLDILPRCSKVDDTHVRCFVGGNLTSIVNYSYDVSYSCLHSNDCYHPTGGGRNISSIDYTFYANTLSFNTGDNINSYNMPLYLVDGAGGDFSCQGMASVSNNLGKGEVTCTPLPIGAYYLHNSVSNSASLPGVGANNGVIIDTVTIASVNLPRQVKKDIPFIIAYPAATCQDSVIYEDMGSFVFEENGTDKYTVHSVSGKDSLSVRLVPKKSLTTCTHNISSQPGGDPYAKNYYKLNLVSSSAACSAGLTSSLKAKVADNNLDTVIEWMISGLSSLSAGMQVECTHNLVTELTWY